jgi:NADH:ubiquinone oxidoreductase subunit F (NADH-binding)
MYTLKPGNPKSVVFLKPEKTKSVVLDGKLLILKRCAKCDAEFYGEETQVKCEPCRSAVRRSATTKRKKKSA